MGLFTKICRNTGLMIHHVVKPAPGPPGSAQKREVSRTVEEKQVSPTTTLRRTTIEEIEVKHKQRDDV